MLDLKITGGTVVDGTGKPGVKGDIGIRDGRIVSIGAVTEEATKTIDASGKIVAPGFVDVHTHYDAQLFWDKTLSPSPLHGITSVIGGNCGFSIAPLKPSEGDYLSRMLARVEGMPLESLQKGVPWDWQSFGEFLDRADGLAVNAGFLVGHCALRRCVMGDRADQEASPEELEQMKTLLGESLKEGGLGFSSTLSHTHTDGDGNPVPSRCATHEEIIALSAKVGEYEGTFLEFIAVVGPFAEEHKELMVEMSAQSGRMLNWNVLSVSKRSQPMYEAQLETSDRGAKRGANVLALTVPQVMSMRLNLRGGFLFDSFPGWGEVILKPLPERMVALKDPEIRKKLHGGATSKGAGPLRGLARWDLMTIAETFLPENKKYEGRSIGDVAKELDKTPFDTLCDLAISEELRTSFAPLIPGDDEETWKLRAEVWEDPRTLVGASDAGAHLDMIDTFSYCTTLLSRAVRELKLLTVERAIHHLSDAPARAIGLTERGRIAEGWHADIVVFDMDTVGVGPLHTRQDLPGDESRLFAEAIGIEHVIVNGVPIVEGQEYTGSLPGIALRSGRDTVTVPNPAQ